MMQNKHIVTQKFCVTERKFEKGVKEQIIILVYFPIFLYYSSILKGKEKGRILNTNAESGYDNWQWGNYNQQQQMDINAYKQQQLANAKKSGGILNTNVESGDWNGLQYNPPNQGNPKAVDRNQMPFGSKGGSTVPGKVGGDPNEVIKMDTENKFVMEGGRKKKITTIKKTLSFDKIKKV